jgi:hypothetical protein
MAQNKFSTLKPPSPDPQNTSNDDPLYDSYQSIDPQFNADEISGLNHNPNFIESVGQEYNSLINDLNNPRPKAPPQAPINLSKISEKSSTLMQNPSSFGFSQLQSDLELLEQNFENFKTSQ